MSKTKLPKDQAETYLAKVIDYKRTFGSQAGKKVLHDMMQAHYFLNSSYVRDNRDEVIFREGQRNVILRILTLLDQDPDKIRNLIREATDGNEAR